MAFLHLSKKSAPEPRGIQTKRRKIPAKDNRAAFKQRLDETAKADAELQAWQSKPQVERSREAIETMMDFHYKHHQKVGEKKTYDEARDKIVERAEICDKKLGRY